MIKGIQLLRAIAALAVVFFHCHFSNLETGMFGVDIFFVISGFIIAYMVNQNTSQFIIKRIIRVSPLYFLGTALTIALSFIRPQWFNHVVVTKETIFKSFLFIPYEIDGSGPILSLGWTLNNEMFFYGIMFLCIISFRQRKYLVPACATILTLMLVILNLFGKNIISEYSYILRFYRNGLLPEFIYGLGLYYFWRYFKKEDRKISSTLMVSVGIISFLTMIYLDLTHSLLWLPRNIRYGILSLLFVNAMLLLEDKINDKNTPVKIALKLGDASYAMYLFHPFVIYFLMRVVYPKIIGPKPDLVIEVAEVIFNITLVCVLSIFIYQLIDKPTTKFLKNLMSKYKYSLPLINSRKLQV